VSRSKERSLEEIKERIKSGSSSFKELLLKILENEIFKKKCLEIETNIA